AGRVHGATTRRETGRPPDDAASILSGSPGFSGHEPVQAARRSANTGGAHSGTAAASLPTSTPVARRSGFQSGSAGAGTSAARSPGTTRSDTSLPSGSSSTRAMPGTSCGGSSIQSPTDANMRFTIGFALSRYQKWIPPGGADLSASHRPGPAIP